MLKVLNFFKCSDMFSGKFNYDYQDSDGMQKFDINE